ncbi:MAG TPA: DUF885 family protein [Sphingomonas sp.]|nr:DUF885 family protein [Sphingomonas sp.]
MIDRRAAIVGLAAGLTLPASLSAQGRDLGEILDAAVADPRAGLAALDRLAAPSTLAGRLDRDAARAGLAADVALQLFWGPARAGRPLFRVTPRAGAWRSPARDAEAIDRDTAALAHDVAAGILLPHSAIAELIPALDAAAATASRDVASALGRQRALLVARPAPAPGLVHLRNGPALYAALLRRTSGSAAPAAARRRLVRERDALLARADRLFRRVGLATGTVGDRYSALFRDPRWLYSDDDNGRSRAIDEMNAMTAHAASHVAATVEDVPGFCLDARVRALSAVELAKNVAGYREVPAPGRAGAYVVDLKDIRRRPRWTLPSVVAHELLPGHMIQLGIEGITPPHPLRLDYAAAFVEGWGIHAETLAGEAGAFADPHVELGHIHWLLFRVARALADLAIHLDGWSLARTRAALVEWQGEPAYFAPFDVELSRIAIEPTARVAEALAWFAIRDAVAGLDPAARRGRHAALLAGGRKRNDAIAALPKETA